MALTLSQLEGYDVAAGWPAQLVPTAAAVEEAESSGNLDAIGPGGSWGPFQIQPQYHPNIAKTSDPVAASAAGLQVYESQGWGAWTTYRDGAYKKYLSAAESAAGKRGSAPSSSAGTGSCGSGGTWSDATCGPLDPACALQNFTGAIMCKIGWIGGQLGLGAEVVLGLALLFAGLWFLIRNTGLGKAIKSDLKKGARLAAVAA